MKEALTKITEIKVLMNDTTNYLKYLGDNLDMTIKYIDFLTKNNQLTECYISYTDFTINEHDDDKLKSIIRENKLNDITNL